MRHLCTIYASMSTTPLDYLCTILHCEDASKEMHMPRKRLDPESVERIRVWISVPGWLRKQVDVRCARNGETMSQLIRRAIEKEF